MNCKVLTMNTIFRRLLLAALAFGSYADGTIIHVATMGDDANPSSAIRLDSDYPGSRRKDANPAPTSDSPVGVVPSSNMMRSKLD